MAKDPYASYAGKYDKWVEPMNKAIRRIGLKLAPGKPGMHVLDVGCGTGTHLALYQEAGCQVVGFEASPAMFAQAKGKLGSEVELHYGDATNMPFDDDSFDLSILSLVLHETDPEIRENILKETIRVTKADGDLLIIDYHPERRNNWNGLWKKALILFVERMAGSRHYRNYRHFIANNGILFLADRHKLTITEKKIVAGGNVGVYVARVSG